METTEPFDIPQPHDPPDPDSAFRFDAQRRALCHAFCLESAERLGRVRSAAERLAGGASPGPVLDRIHQELDSLYGAARAVDLPRVASTYRTVAAHARLLRRGLPGSLQGGARDRLEAAIAALPGPDAPCTEACMRRLEARATDRDPIRDLPGGADAPGEASENRCSCDIDRPGREDDL